MYSNTTQNMELPQWGPKDYFQVMADMNPALKKIDDKFGEVDNKSEELDARLTTLDQTVQENTKSITENSAKIDEHEQSITELNQLMDGVKQFETTITKALNGLANVTKETIQKLVEQDTALQEAINAETERARGQEEIIDTKATAASNAAANAENNAIAANTAAQSAEAAAQEAKEASQRAQEAAQNAEQVSNETKADVTAKAESAANDAKAAKEAAEAADRQATLSAGFASNAARDAQAAIETANDAKTIAEDASTSAEQAKTSASAAEESAADAQTKATEAASSAATAEQKATEAAQSASTAESAATAAGESATNAATAAEEAKQSAAEAKAEADAAHQSADSAAESAGTAASTSADALLKAEQVEEGFNQLKDTDWPAYKAGIDSSIEGIRESVSGLGDEYVKKSGDVMTGRLGFNELSLQDTPYIREISTGHGIVCRWSEEQLGTMHGATDGSINDSYVNVQYLNSQLASKLKTKADINNPTFTGDVAVKGSGDNTVIIRTAYEDENVLVFEKGSNRGELAAIAVDTPAKPTHATNKEYVDNAISTSSQEVQQTIESTLANYMSKEQADETYMPKTNIPTTYGMEVKNFRIKNHSDQEWIAFDLGHSSTDWPGYVQFAGATKTQNCYVQFFNNTGSLVWTYNIGQVNRSFFYIDGGVMKKVSVTSMGWSETGESNNSCETRFIPDGGIPQVVRDTITTGFGTGIFLLTVTLH